jgi:hypothetical protein
MGAPNLVRPVVEPMAPQKPQANVVVRGRTLRGPPDAITRVRLQTAPRGELKNLPTAEFSDTSVQITLPAVPDGYHLLFVLANDVAGGQVVRVDSTSNLHQSAPPHP